MNIYISIYDFCVLDIKPFVPFLKKKQKRCLKIRADIAHLEKNRADVVLLCQMGIQILAGINVYNFNFETV